MHCIINSEATRMYNFIIFYILTKISNFYLKLNIIYIYKLNYFDVTCNISFKEHLPEDGHNRWPKHVGGCDVYNIVNLHI